MNREKNVFTMIFIARRNYLDKHETTQGFITSYGRFVDRKEAMEIALKCGQVREEYLGNKRIGLFSEDIFPHQTIYAK